MSGTRQVAKPTGCRVKPGDVCQILTSGGGIYGLATHKHPKRSYVVAIFGEAYDKVPKDFAPVAAGEPQFITTFLICDAVRDGLFTVVAHVEVPQHLRDFPTFRTTNQLHGDQRLCFFRDGERERRVDRPLTEEERRCPEGPRFPSAPALFEWIEKDWRAGRVMSSRPVPARDRRLSQVLTHDIPDWRAGQAQPEPPFADRALAPVRFAAGNEVTARNGADVRDAGDCRPHRGQSMELRAWMQGIAYDFPRFARPRARARALFPQQAFLLPADAGSRRCGIAGPMMPMRRGDPSPSGHKSHRRHSDAKGAGVMRRHPPLASWGRALRARLQDVPP